MTARSVSRAAAGAALTLIGLTACTPTGAGGGTTFTGHVFKEPSYATYTTIGIAIGDREYGDHEGNLRPYCDDVVDGFGLGGNAVTVKDADGTIIGTAALTFDESTAEQQGGYLKCSWMFTIETASDSDFFELAVDGVSGSQVLSREEFLAGAELIAPDN